MPPSEWPEVRVISDGTGQDTVVTFDGKEVNRVTDLNLFLGVQEVNRMDMTILMPKVDVHAKVRQIRFMCPICEGELLHSCAYDK